MAVMVMVMVIKDGGANKLNPAGLKRVRMRTVKTYGF
jgi:hypothetical protein